MESLSSKQRRVALPYPQHHLGAAEAAEQQRASRRKRPRRQLQPQQHRTATDVEDTAASCRQCVQVRGWQGLQAPLPRCATASLGHTRMRCNPLHCILSLLSG